MLLAVIISYAEKIVNRKAVPFGAAFSLRFSPPSLSEAKKPGHRFPIPLSCRSFGGEEKKRRCVQIPIPLPARLPPAPISVARHKEKPFPLSSRGFGAHSPAPPRIPSINRSFAPYYTI